VEVGVSAGRTTQALQLGGLAAAVVLAVLVNVLSARHFTRWDWTSDRRWTPSPATVETLHALQQRVDVWVVAAPGEPVEATLRPLLAAYRAESSRLEVTWIDPDRDAVQLLDLQRRFGLEAGRADDGRVVTDATVIVASGDQHWFLTTQDLYETSGDDARARPREERALTRAIRSVLGTQRATLCFTAGHGELSLEPDRADRDDLQLAAAGLRDLLDKSNYDLKTVETLAPDAHEPFQGCSVVVVAGQLASFSSVEAERLRTWLLQGGSLFAAVGPIEGSTPTGLVESGLDPALAPFGIAMNDDVVQDPDPAVSVAGTHAEGFYVTAQPHPVTASLTVGADAHPPRTAVYFSRSLRHVSPAGAAAASDLLVTSDASYAKTSVVGASGWKDAPPHDPGDPKGPFVLAMASERPRIGPSAPHGPRVVVVGTRFILAEDNWRQPRPLHGAAFFVDSALSWLAARPAMVDVPDKAEVAAGIRVSAEARAEVQRYVLVFMPLAIALMAASVWAWRRNAENKPYVRAGSREGRAKTPESTA
jgi:hypothetical protein